MIWGFFGPFQSPQHQHYYFSLETPGHLKKQEKYGNILEKYDLREFENQQFRKFRNIRAPIF